MVKMTAHFWAGKFDNESRFNDFFEESYPEENEDDDDDAPISKFAESQGETWIDHDFLEKGFEDSSLSLQDRFMKYSYGEHWFAEFEKRLTKKGLSDSNTIVMNLFDEGTSEIESPQSFSGTGFDVHYLGTIEFDYEHPDWFKDILAKK